MKVTSVLFRKVATNPSTGWVADRVAFEVGILPVKTAKPEGPRHTARHKAELKARNSRSSMEGAQAPF
jgi:hypothetical protein